MGLWNLLTRAAAMTASPTISPMRQDIVSPFAAGQLQQIVWSDVFGRDTTLITREEAMSIGGVTKARAILLALLADKPLIAYDEAELEAADAELRDPVPLPEQPPWLRSTASANSPWHRMASTIDDIIFYGYCLWATRRDGAGNIEAADRVPIGDWHFGEHGELMFGPRDGVAREVQASEAFLIAGPSEGLLAYATRALRGAIAIEEAWVDRAENPIGILELHQTVESNMDDEEFQARVDAVRERRKQDGGAALIGTPNDVELREHAGVADSGIYVEGRNASRIDIANFFNLPASLLDATTATASLTYSTQEGDTNELHLLTTPYWARPTEGRLSQDDVAGPGIVIRQRFDAAVRPEQSPIGEPGNV